jgi:TRAP-type mannitol/chloroaromatic compound transport system permease small subunit
MKKERMLNVVVSLLMLFLFVLVFILTSIPMIPQVGKDQEQSNQNQPLIITSIAPIIIITVVAVAYSCL